MTKLVGFLWLKFYFSTFFPVYFELITLLQCLKIGKIIFVFLIKVKSDWESSEEEVEDGEQQNTHVPTSSQASSPHEVSPPLVSPPHTDSDETDSALPPRSVEMDIDFPLIDNNVLLTDNNNVSSNQGCSARKRPRVRMRGRGVAGNTGIVRGKSIRCRGGSNRGGANGVEIAGGSREDSADGAAVGGGGSSDGATVGSCSIVKTL